MDEEPGLPDRWDTLHQLDPTRLLDGPAFSCPRSDRLLPERDLSGFPVGPVVSVSSHSAMKSSTPFVAVDHQNFVDLVNGGDEPHVKRDT